jgi:hypothetical protein
MAKAKFEVNRSEAIREAYKELPKAKAKEIVAYLETKGITVAEGLVYQVKKISKQKAKKKPGRKPGQASKAKVAVSVPSSNGVLAPASKGPIGIGASIAVVKAAADKVGGWAALKEIVDALA